MTEPAWGSRSFIGHTPAEPPPRRRARRLGRILLAFFVAITSFVNVGADGCGGPYPANPNPLVTAAAPPVRSYSGRPLRVLLVGDSVLDQMGSHAQIALRQAGAEVLTVGRWGSALFTRDQYDFGAVAANPPPGTWLGDAPGLIDDFDPDVVAIYLNHNYWPPAPRDAQGNPIALGGAGFLEMAQALLREFV
ncbi:MAG TPA: hypothetical protein VLF14_01380, partial [Candidatus Binatia bacterium]|nr:hypothetical protein [Candidatus Binatia bacterium]